MKQPKLFIGMETTNIDQFVSPCCRIPLSLEPLCRIACGGCGKTVPEDKAVWRPHHIPDNPTEQEVKLLLDAD